MRTGVQIIEVNSLFDIFYHEWRAKTTASRTITAFKAHLRLAEIEYNRAVTTSSAAYNTGLAAIYQTTHPDFPSSLSSPISVVLFLIGMTIHDLPFLTTPAEFAVVAAEASMIIGPPSPAFSQAYLAAAVTSAVNAALSRNPGTQNTTCTEGYSYFWSHGYVPQHGHNPHSSANCKHKKTGHKDDSAKDSKKREERHTSINTVPVQLTL